MRYRPTSMDVVPGRARIPRVPVPGLVIGVVVLEVVLILGFGLYAALLSVLVPGALWLSKRPQRGILVLAALLPFNGLLIIAGLPGIVKGWKEALVIFLLFLTFIVPDATRRSDRKLPPWMPALGALLVVAFLSGLTEDWLTAYTGLRISYFDVLIFFVIWRAPLNRKEIDHLVTIFVVVGIITAAVGVWQQTVGYAYLNSLGYSYNETIRFASGLRLRSFSTFNQPFPFAFYLMLVILLATPFALAEPRRLRNRIFFISLPLLAAGLVFSYVRGAMLGLGIGLLYLAFHRYKLLVAGIPLILVALLFLPSGTSFTNALFQRHTLTARTTGWKDHVDTVIRHPLGVGIGKTGAAGAKVASLENPQSNNNPYQPDNSYVKVGLELGLIGLWLMLLMLVTMVLYTRSVERRTTGVDSHFATAVTAQLLAIIAASWVATYFEMLPMDQFFWLMAGIVATLAPAVKASSAPMSSRQPLALLQRRVPTRT